MTAVRGHETFSSAKGLTTHPDEIGAPGLEPAIRDFVRSRPDLMAQRAAVGEPVDLHRAYSSPIPTFTPAHLLGVPDVRALTTPEAVAEMFGYFSEVVAARPAVARDDLICALTQAEVDGERLRDGEILGFCFVIVAGGNDTTARSARAEGAAALRRVAIEELYARFPHVGVDVTKGERTRSPSTRGWVSLPVTGL